MIHTSDSSGGVVNVKCTRTQHDWCYVWGFSHICLCNHSVFVPFFLVSDNLTVASYHMG